MSWVVSALLALAASGQDEESLQTLPGFRAELLYAVPREEGSWVAFTFDLKGRLLVSPEQGSLRRVTLPRDGAPLRSEKLDGTVGDAQGLLWAHGGLYVNGKGPQGAGFYRLQDLDRDDCFETVTLLRKWPLEMTEHGPHGIVRGPDDKLYLVNGNYVKAPENLAASSPHGKFAEDLLLPRQWDATGHAVGLRAPGGVVLRTDAEGKEWELFCGGLRNAYDLAFSPEGELFTYDSDMERDLGTPWYRPTRILHLVSGGEYGWRSGSGKWPASYPDSLPAAVDIGRGSPTGVVFGTGSRFPAKHQRALFAADWAFGRILAVHLAPAGASFTGAFETFVSGRPLNVTDLEFGPDGAMYFITGGRGTLSKLYRVAWTGSRVEASSYSLPPAMAARRHLETFHLIEGAPPDELWPYLGHRDRWLRFAARIALERTESPGWKDRAFAEKDANTSITALIALARVGTKEDLPRILESLGRHAWGCLSERLKLDWLRACQLAFIRLGPPGDAEAERIRLRLEKVYPDASEALNRELCQLLVFLKSPVVIPRTLARMSSAPSREDQTHSAFALRTVDRGWTLPERRTYFEWFNREAAAAGDVGFPLFVRNIKSDAIATLSEEEKRELEPLLRAEYAAAGKAWRGRDPVVKQWTMGDLLSELDRVSKNRNFVRGKATFTKAQCLACHRLGFEGGLSGPDLTGVARRFTRRDLLESILEPSKVVSAQFRSTLVQTEDGDVLLGKIVDQKEGRLFLQADPLDEQVTELSLSRVRQMKPSELSSMPDGLVNTLTLLEILDLLAYLETDGNPQDARFPSK